MTEETLPPRTYSLLERCAFTLGALFGVNLRHDATPSPSDTPDGLVYLYSERTSEEAELTRQILREAGFHVEFVPQMWSGIYGQRGSPDIYVRTDEVQEVLGFLKDLRFPDSESHAPIDT